MNKEGEAAQNLWRHLLPKLGSNTQYSLRPDTLREMYGDCYGARTCNYRQLI